MGGVARLYGEAGAERLAAAHVVVVGLGGVGSWAVEALVRSGVGRLALLDGAAGSVQAGIPSFSYADEADIRPRADHGVDRVFDFVFMPLARDDRLGRAAGLHQKFAPFD